jgi:hypothetical protein
MPESEVEQSTERRLNASLNFSCCLTQSNFPVIAQPMNELWMTIVGFIIPWAMTSLGAAIVFFFRNPLPEILRAGILAFAAGIMTSASFFALLLPSLEEADL